MAFEKRIGSTVRHIKIVDINECMHECGVEDIKSVGNLFTWNNKHQGATRVFSNLDRVLANAEWQRCFMSEEVCFMNEGEFDNSPCLITVYPSATRGRKPFKYFTMWKASPKFLDLVQNQWNVQIQGSKIYVPKAKIDWIKAGNENTALFHQSIKSRNTHNKVYNIHDMDGNWRDTPVVQDGPLVTDAHKAILNAPYTREEVKHALFSIPGVKAPGPDGFGSYFYRDAWSVVGDDVIDVVLDGFVHGKLLKEINHTVITLIPKIKCPKNDLVKQYGRENVKPSCLMKVDLQKAYDTVDWGLLHEMLNLLGFLNNFVKLVMEILHRMSSMPQFQFHPRCKDVRLSHLFFADGLILCCKGDYASIYLLLQAFKLFSKTSGSSLPFKYLGVPIFSKKITTAQCGVLVEKMTARIKVWSTRNLSYTARMQLINYVLISFHMYWSQIYILPRSVLQKIVKICRAFLWSGHSYSTKTSNIKWNKVCCEKQAGGLGFKNVLRTLEYS
ncbi:uncharacterized protein [Spinacia oleracea]|uniref:Reverse transcriptase domain-containing protein n=1 Tax=Spinacia oleracea TaxID=3562 RepID=A0ABM3RR67_SPIOL|nr:uncharacterized protein LOC130471817 [Spinacia oleracea]